MNSPKMVRFRVLLLRLLLITAVFLVGFFLLSGRLREKQGQENALRTRLTELEEANKSLEAELKLVDTEDYIVSSAMTNYAFMNKNDLRFQFTNPDALDAYTESELKILMDEMNE